MSFDPVQYMKDANAKEAAQRTGAPVPEKPAEKPAEAAVAVAEPEDPEEKQEQEHARLPRSARRAITQRDREIGRLQGMLEAYQKIGSKPAEEEKTAPAIDPEARPERANYATDAEHAEAVAEWKTNAVLAKSEAERGLELRERAAFEKAVEDSKLFPDWDEKAKKAENIDLKEHPFLLDLIKKSEYRALALYYLTSNPDELDDLMDLTSQPDKSGNLVKQYEAFRLLEGHLKRVYKGLKSKAAEPAKEAVKEPEPKPVKLPKPSESVAARGGSAPVTDIAPYLADGKTINPAWKEQRNQREGARR